MAVDLLQWALQSQSPLRVGVVRTFIADNPIARRLRFITRSTPFYPYNKEASLPGVSYRAINTKYTPTKGVIVPAVERMVNFGGVIHTDEAIVNRDGGPEERANQRAMMVTAAQLKFQRDFFWGDSAVDPQGFDGVATRLSAGQVVDGGGNGVDISIALVQELQSKVVGDNAQKVLLMSDLQRRKLSTAVLAAAGGATLSDAGKTIMEFDRSPIEVIANDNLGNPILAQDETTGSDAETGSIFCVRFGADLDGQNLQGLMTSNAFQIRDVGRDENILKDLLDMEIGLAMFRGDCAARLKGLKK